MFADEEEVSESAVADKSPSKWLQFDPIFNFGREKERRTASELEEGGQKKKERMEGGRGGFV